MTSKNKIRQHRKISKEKAIRATYKDAAIKTFYQFKKTFELLGSSLQHNNA